MPAGSARRSSASKNRRSLTFIFIALLLYLAHISMWIGLTYQLCQRVNLGLLLLDGIEHRPEDGIIVDEQEALAVLRHGFGNDLLQGLCTESDVLTRGVKAECV